MQDAVTTADQRDKRKASLICIALAAVVFCAFEKVQDNDFVNYDDDLYVTDNAFVRGGLSAQSIAWAFTSWQAANWHPLTWASHIIDCSVFGVDPAWHHLVSVGFHIANVVLLFLVLKKMTGAIWPSAFVAAVFGLHPLAVESVAWVAQRKTVLSTFFAFLTIAAYLRYVQKPGLWRYLAVAVVFAAGLLSKPMLVTLPFVLVLLDFWPLGRFGEAGGWRRLWLLLREKLPLLVMSAVFCVVTYIAQARTGAVADIVLLPLSLRACNALVSYIRYIGKLFYPVSLAVLYPLDLRPALWEAGGSLAMLLTVTAAVILWGRRRGYLLMGWLWYLGTLVPVIGLVQAGNQSMADRYMYLPGIGIYIIVAWLTGEVAAKLRWPKIVPAAAGVLVLVVLLLITRVQVGYWKDSFSLCRHALAVTKDNEVIHNNLGCALGDKGLVGEAAAEFELAIKIRPGYARAHYNYGVTLAKRGLYDEAIEHFSKALATNPYCSNALHNLCKTGVVSGKLDVVLGVIRDLEQKTPANAELYYRAGTIYEKQGNIAAAIEQLEKALKLAGNEGRKELAGQIKERLESYQH